MSRRWRISLPWVLLLACLMVPVGLSGCANLRTAHKVPIYEADGIKQVSAVQDGRLTFYDGQNWVPGFWGGVNLGATTAGHAPGELSPTKADYARWLTQIKAMDARVVRVYTILPPAFYEAFAEFNRRQEEPLWLIHGIWSPEEELIGEDGGGRNAFDPQITETFLTEITHAVKAVHGDITLPERRGHASGRYRTDISPYVLGWIVGTEWYPLSAAVTNDANPGMKPYAGTYFSAKTGASPFESWLARMLDHLAAEEMKYGWQRPISFTNWPTTDPLSHPNEPHRTEDMVSIDPMLIAPTVAFRGGYFAAYHIYPYYPDFLRYEPRYAKSLNYRGEADPYAGYLREIRAHHEGIPLIIAEFGVPSSRGIAHYAPLNRNQGMHTEQEQAEINVDLLNNIYEEGMDGALIFAWHDEWHKFTWNTIELELPDYRRPIWLNRLTNEQHFGMMAVEPGAKQTILLDGSSRDWPGWWKRTRRSYPEFDLTLTHDEGYLYLLMRKKAGAWDFAAEPLHIGFSTSDSGSRTADKAPGITFARPIQFLASFTGDADSRIFVNSAFDQHTWRWGVRTPTMPVDPAWSAPEAGAFLPWRLLLSHPLELPTTQQQIPYEEYEVGLLRKGIFDPASSQFNSLADWYAEGEILEVRIPWQLLGFTDPSSHLVWQSPYVAGKIEPVKVEGIYVEPRTGGGDAPGKPLYYKWDAWNVPTYHERLKASYYLVGERFATYRRPSR